MVTDQSSCLALTLQLADETHPGHGTGATAQVSWSMTAVTASCTVHLLETLS